MKWEAWLVIGAIVLRAVVSVLIVGRPQGPMLPHHAASRLVLSAGMVWLIWRIGAA